jgi:hypothetical protein
MILGSGRRLPLNSATHPETLQINSAIASFFCLSSDAARDSGILPAIPCLMILICVFLSVPILPTSLAFSDYGSLRYYRVLYLIIPEANRNNGACQTVYRSKEAPTRRVMRKLIQSLLSGVQNAQSGPQGVNPGESLGLGRRSPAKSARMCAEAVAPDGFSAFGATAQPANSSVKNATTVRLTAPPLSILFFINPFI